MKKIIYTLIAVVGLFLTFGESDSAFTNIIGIVILVALSWKLNLLKLNDDDK